MGTPVKATPTTPSRIVNASAMLEVNPTGGLRRGQFHVQTWFVRDYGVSKVLVVGFLNLGLK